MIYFDNGATGGFKPRASIEACYDTIRFLSANPGRSGHRLSLTGAKILFSCREFLGEMFGTEPERVIFTKNCTEALNIAILGSVKKGGEVITTTFEHNSVLRPLYKLKESGAINLHIVSPTDKLPIEKAIEEKINDKTYLIVCTAVSNVTGLALPLKEIGKTAKKHNIKFIIDGAQGGGHIPLTLKNTGANAIALAGHKGLYGIMGSGVLLFDKNTEFNPIMYGGTGTESFNIFQPSTYPEKLEAGTLNLPAIASLLEGAKYIKPNILNFGETLSLYTQNLIDGLSDIKGIKVYSKKNKSGIVSFSLEGVSSSQVADTLNSEYDIAVRGGLHCSPLTHKFLKTEDGGLLRASLSVQNTSKEIKYFINAVKKISGY